MIFGVSTAATATETAYAVAHLF